MWARDALLHADGALLRLCALKGGSPERFVAVIILLGTLLTLLVAPEKTWRFGSVHLGIFAVDLAMFFAFVAVALYAERFWPIWMSAMQGFGIVGHLSVWIAPHISPVVYATSHAVASYPIVLCCWRSRPIGTSAAWRPARRVRSWSDHRARARIARRTQSA
ncbi:MAG: hypothetical protein WDN44_15445 [Sphingomonas sp.]